MKNKTKISIVMALLMVVSTFSVGTATAECIESTETGDIEVIKTLWNGTDWVDAYTAEIGETVTVNITIIYHEFCGFIAQDIKVVDSLDFIGEISYTLDFTDSEYQPSETGQPLVWNLSDDYGIVLHHDPGQDQIDRVSIYYNITPVCGCGEIINSVQVYALEHCCGADLYGQDSATITVECEPPCEPGIEVEKKVWNGTAWAEYVEDITIGDYVDFKITMNYEDCDTDYDLLNLIVKDTLPCCLEFYETLDIYSDAVYMDDPTEDVSADGKVVYWNWTWGEAIILAGGESLTIEFRAVFVNYCEGDSENLAEIWAWGCSGPEFYDHDNALVNCDAPDNEFDKKVWDGNKWVDEINTTVGETLRFKLSLLYYGAGEYDIFRFKDKLPCILEYADNAMAYVKDDGEVLYSMPVEGDLQSDNKTVWFNFTYIENFTISDGLEVSVEFDALVTGMTECGCGCDMEFINKAWLFIYDCGQQEAIYDFYDDLQIHSEGNCEPYPLGIEGPSTGLVGQELTFKTTIVDPDDDQVYFKIDFGDGVVSISWLGPYDSGEEITLKHTYNAEGTFGITVKAKDEHGSESEETYPHFVEITEIEPEEDIEISIPEKLFYMKNIDANIKNNGDLEVTDVDWEFVISGGLLGKTIESNGTIASIASGADEDIASGAVTMTFGMRTISITVTVGSETYSVLYDCFVLGRLIILM